ncbi:TetR/AcrR family transcriptional regulator [Roseococcus sp.]|uniref:TetR/AcrR family transcriptional regulator n=1 Tax=Roseococcus sp. TaxID=2109646 RepID=UPI003BAC77DB
MDNVDEISPKRRQVLDAAGRLFTSEGFAAVSMDAVAREAGVSKATLYAYFTGKHALFGAVVAERCVAMVEASRIVNDHDAPLRECMRRQVDFWLRFLISPAAIGTYRTVLAEGGRFPDLAHAFYEAGPAAGLRWIGLWIAEEQRRGRLRAEIDPRRAAPQFTALLRGDLYIQVALGLIPVPSEEAIVAEVDAATDTLLRAYAAA